MKDLVFNNLERAVSNDVNRLQKFKAKDLAEMFRYLFVDGVSQDSQGGSNTGQGDEVLTQTSPLTAMVINGLLVQPSIGTDTCTVDPGVLWMVDPDATPDSDDSVYKYISDPGTGAAPLLLVANSSGQVRIDVIECSRISSDVESDNRDIFNTATGMFTATTVVKVRAGKLQYRIRQGTNGAGFPGTAQGWLPLAVAAVSGTASTWNDVTLWDVRPLVGDLETSPTPSFRDFARLHHVHLECDAATNVAKNYLRGLADGAPMGTAYKGGGSIALGNDGEVNLGIDLWNAANNEPGVVFTNARPWYLWLVQPFGLPRWVRYTPSSFGFRYPRASRGIPVISTKSPGYFGAPSSALTLPTSTGLIGTSTTALCVAAGAVYLSKPNIIRGDGRAIQFQTGLVSIAANAGETTSNTDFTLTDGVHYPKNAVALYVNFRITINAAAAHNGFVPNSVIHVTDNALNQEWESRPSGIYVPAFTSGGGIVSAYVVSNMRIPLSVVGNQLATPGSANKLIEWQRIGIETGISYDTGSLEIVGWELGPN